MTTVHLPLILGGRSSAEPVAIKQAVIAGWTGRDPEAVEKHILELEALGVRRPASTPIFYRVSASRLTLADHIEAAGTASSGEVELVLLQSAGALWVGVGSDHTDREVEAYNVTVSKQMCDKPLAAEFWPFDELRPHWDQLILRSRIVEGGATVLYQEGLASSFREPLDLIGRFSGGDRLREGTLMFCGTLAARGGVRPAGRFDFELEDPVRRRVIKRGYDITCLPVAG